MPILLQQYYWINAKVQRKFTKKERKEILVGQRTRDKRQQREIKTKKVTLMINLTNKKQVFHYKSKKCKNTKQNTENQKRKKKKEKGALPANSKLVVTKRQKRKKAPSTENSSSSQQQALAQYTPHHSPLVHFTLPLGLPIPHKYPNSRDTQKREKHTENYHHPKSWGSALEHPFKE